MVYDHLVKHNGKYYEAGEDVPEEINVFPSTNEEVSDLDDEGIVLETDAVYKPKSSGRRGRPKQVD